MLHERVIVAHGSLLLQAFFRPTSLGRRWLLLLRRVSVRGVLPGRAVLRACPCDLVPSCHVWDVPSLPPMCDIRGMRACENAQFFCPCTAGRRHAEILLDPTTDVHGSCADVTRIGSPRRPTGRNRCLSRMCVAALGAKTCTGT